MEKETKTVRVSLDTLDKLKAYGEFRDNWDNCIQRVINSQREMHTELKQLRQILQKERKEHKEQIKQLKQKKQKEKKGDR